MLHGAIFLATCNAILLLRDVKLPNTSLRYTPLMFSQHIEYINYIYNNNLSNINYTRESKMYMVNKLVWASNNEKVV